MQKAIIIVRGHTRQSVQRKIRNMKKINSEKSPLLYSNSVHLHLQVMNIMT